MNRDIRGAAFAAAPFLPGSAAHAQWTSAYTAPRNAVVDANGARLIEVEASAGSGELTIENVRGDVRVSDGSGGINVRDVSGSFTVRTDGSSPFVHGYCRSSAPGG